jgi:hypothetical protein
MMKKNNGKKLTLSRETLRVLKQRDVRQVNGQEALVSTECCSYPCTTVYPDW